MVMIIGIGLLVAGIFLFRKGRQISRSLEKAAFNRRNQSGVETFQSFEDAEKINRKELKQRFVMALLKTAGWFGMGWGVMLAVLGAFFKST